MLKSVVKTWRMFRRTLRGVDSPRQLALGVALGMLIGVLPKDSLLPYLFVVLLLLSTANLLCGAVSTLCFSWVSLCLDPIAHHIGGWVLTFDPFETLWAWLHGLPIVPWTRFENTIVMGSLLIGLVGFLPIYQISYQIFENYGSTLSERLLTNPLTRWILGYPSQRLQKS